MHDVGGFFHQLWEDIDKVWQVWLKTNEQVLDAIKKTWDRVWHDVKQIVVDVVHAIGLVLTPFWKLFEFEAKTTYAITMWLWHGIYNDIIKPVVDLVKALFSDLERFFVARWQNLYNNTKMVWNLVYNDAIKPIYDLIVAGATTVWHLLDGVWQAIWGVIAPVFTAVGHAGQDAWNAIVSVWQGAVAWFKGLFDGVSSAGSSAAKGIGGFFSQIWSDIKNDAKVAINFVINLLDDMIKAYNSTVGKIPGAPKISSIPKFASGVSNFGGGWALVGEQGAELAQLPQGTNVYNNTQTKSMLQAGNSFNFAGANFNFHTAAAVDEFFNIGNRNSQLELNGISPLAGTSGV